MNVCSVDLFSNFELMSIIYAIPELCGRQPASKSRWIWAAVGGTAAVAASKGTSQAEALPSAQQKR